jgi:hypothetical protein
MPTAKSRKRETPVEFKPDYERECANCEQSPVVMAIDATGKNHMDRRPLCGPCCFGEARMVDPNQWNE